MSPRGQVEYLRGDTLLVPKAFSAWGVRMRVPQIVYWEEDGAWLGYLQDYPDYWTQGETLADLRDHLRDLYHELSSGRIPSQRRNP